MTSLSDKKFPSGREKNDKQFVMEISIESTVNFTKKDLDVNHHPDLYYLL